MISTKDLSALLATLYAAPLEPENWQVFFDHLCALTNTASGYMVSVRPRGNELLAGGGLNFEPEILSLYNEHYAAGDPYTEPATANRTGGIISGEALVRRYDLLRSELYNDLLRRYDLEHMTLLSCGWSVEGGDMFPLWRSPKQGAMDAASLQLLRTLLPHVRTAIRLRTKVMDYNISEQFSEASLDAMSIAALLVTDKGQVRHMNQRAAALLQCADGLLLRGGALTATDSRESAQLDLLIKGAIASNRNIPGSIPGGAMRILRVHEKTPLQVTILPLPEQDLAVQIEPVAMVFVGDPSSSPRPRGAFMQQLYGLTPTESRLADLLLEGLDVREAAERLHTSLGTARFHLKRVFAKTGTRRQTQLMRLMLSLPER